MIKLLFLKYSILHKQLKRYIFVILHAKLSAACFYTPQTVITNLFYLIAIFLYAFYLIIRC